MNLQVVKQNQSLILPGLALVLGASIKIALTGAIFMIPVYVIGAGVLYSLRTYRLKITPRVRQLLTVLTLTVFTFLSITSSLPAHAILFDTLDDILQDVISAFGIAEINPIRGVIVNALRFFGVVTVAGIFVGALRSRPGDDEENAANTKKFIKFVAILVFGDLALTLMT